MRLNIVWLEEIQLIEFLDMRFLVKCIDKK